MLANGFKIGNAEVESPKSFKRQPPKCRRLLRTWHRANTEVVRQTGRMKCWRLRKIKLRKALEGSRKMGGPRTNGRPLLRKNQERYLRRNASVRVRS